MKILVRSGEEENELNVNPGGSLLEYLQAADISVNTACGGKGTCFKCRVQVLKGFAAVTEADRRGFSESDFESGWRLSCQCRPRTNLEILAPNTERLGARPRIIASNHKIDEPVWACDLGSTGIVLAVVDRNKYHNWEQAQGYLKSPCPLDIEIHFLNQQVKYGADVMTRLQAAQQQGVELLRDSLRGSLLKCIDEIRKVFPSPQYLKLQEQTLFCAGNSAMTSFILGWDITHLAVAPFQPIQRAAGFWQAGTELEIGTLPLISGFVGGDTFAALLVLKDQPGPWMLLDIGTNTEIVFKKSSGELICTSAPAGPAFEGGNISCGMRAEPGAISEAKFSQGKWQLKTIGNDLPMGVCGSGLIDIVSESLLGGLITEDGYMPGGHLKVSERVSFWPEDVREFQLAKSATRTACEILIERAGEAPARIFLAGAFSQHLRMESVHRVGLIPSGLPCSHIGNASLVGALKWACFNRDERRVIAEEMEKQFRPLELALQDDFQALFVKNINF